MTVTSPFIGAGQSGLKGYSWRQGNLNNTGAMVDILEASYQAGAKGRRAIPVGKILEAAQIMIDKYDDYIIIGSNYSGEDSGIDALIEVGAKMIFVHGIILDSKGRTLYTLLEEISSRDVIPGIATHKPFSTIKFAMKKSLCVRAFLIPFNALGEFMEDQKHIEEFIDNNKEYCFIGMKTLTAGNLNPIKAFEYISKHNISAVAIGMTSAEEAKETTKNSPRNIN